AGIDALMSAGSKSLKSQMRQANARNVPYVVIIGDAEVKAASAVLRDMANARQITVKLSELPGEIGQISLTKRPFGGNLMRKAQSGG
ncbi:His/Gly/Thr/Pro-type tRNA ligase C-terminal domain-containing protein, partial [Chloroflexota bacterium]